MRGLVDMLRQVEHQKGLIGTGLHTFLEKLGEHSLPK